MESKDLNAALASMQLNDEAEALKVEGNELFKRKKWAEAAKKYGKATELDPNCAVYWSNLALCYRKLVMYLEMKSAAQKCIEADDKFIKGYFNLAYACRRMMEFEQAIQALRKGLRASPNDSELVRLLNEVDETREDRKKYHRDVLKISNVKKKLDYYGGLPLSGKSRIPEGTTYSRLERTAVPNLSKKITKCREEGRPVIEQFSVKSLKVAWFASDKEITLEGYMDDEDAPVISFRASSEDSTGLSFCKHYEQNQKWHRILTLDEKDSLMVLLSQKFLREKGYSIDGRLLGYWIRALVAHCMAKSLYKHAADLTLIHADIVFNQNLGNEGYSTKVEVLYRLACSLIMTKDYTTAGDVYSDISEPQRFGIKVDPRSRFSGDKMVNDAILAYSNALDYIKAEAFGVSALREIDTHDWNWSALRNILQSINQSADDLDENSPMNVMSSLIIFTYEQNQCALSCRLKTSEKDYELLKVYIILRLLLSCAGCPYPSGFMSEETIRKLGLPRMLLKQKYRNEEKAQRAIIQAITMPTIEEYHTCVLDCQKRNSDIESFLLYVKETSNAGDIGDKQAKFREAHKSRMKSYKEVYFPGGAISHECPVCPNNLAEEKLKECPCKMVKYCSKRCQNHDWSNHRVVCPFYKKNRAHKE